MTKVDFSGRVWDVKRSLDDRKGPGENYWSDVSNVYDQSVWVDGFNRLHLTIKKRDKWYCSEVISQELFSYGTYTFDVDLMYGFPPGYLPPDINTVLGMFTYTSVKGSADFNEIDIELANFKWNTDCTETNRSLYYVLWFAEKDERRVKCFKLDNTSTLRGIFSFTWSPESVKFSSTIGSATIKEGEYTKRIPLPPVQVHINLWLRKNTTPGKSQQAVINSMTFTPHKDHPPGTLTNKGDWKGLGTVYAAFFDDYKNALKYARNKFNTESAKEPFPVFSGTLKPGRSYQFYGIPWVVFYTSTLYADGKGNTRTEWNLRSITQCHASIGNINLDFRAKQFLY